MVMINSSSFYVVDLSICNIFLFSGNIFDKKFSKCIIFVNIFSYGFNEKISIRLFAVEIGPISGALNLSSFQLQYQPFWMSRNQYNIKGHCRCFIYAEFKFLKSIPYYFKFRLHTNFRCCRFYVFWHWH